MDPRTEVCRERSEQGPDLLVNFWGELLKIASEARRKLESSSRNLSKGLAGEHLSSRGEETGEGQLEGVRVLEGERGEKVERRLDLEEELEEQREEGRLGEETLSDEGGIGAEQNSAG